MKIWLYLLSCLLLFACGDGPTNAPAQMPPAPTGADTLPHDTTGIELSNGKKAQLPPYNFPYHLDRPDATFTLPNKLKEISGLSLTSDGNYLLAVNDEEGRFFYLDKSNGDVKKEIKFNGSGDYEGIEMVDGNIYVAKSNGHIYEVKKPGEKKQETQTFKTALSSGNDVEGLGYDAANNRLLLACKGKAGEGEPFKHHRAVYAFDLQKEKLMEDPVFLIDRDEIKKWADDGREGLTQQLAEFFEPGLADDAFAPSAIAIHPATREAYILSSVGKILVVLDTSGNIAHIEPLDASVHKQPEGICFAPDGSLYISTEGKGGKGKIFRFDRRPTGNRIK